MDLNEVKAIVENLLLAADEPISADRLVQTLQNGAPKAQLEEVLEELQRDYESRPLQIIEVADGFQLCTRPEYAEWVRKFLKLDKTFRMSQPALDTLSIIAYKQPLTRAEVDEIRGVDSVWCVPCLRKSDRARRTQGSSGAADSLPDHAKISGVFWPSGFE